MFAASETTQRVAGSTVLRGTGFDTPRPPPRIRKGWGGKYDDLTKPTKEQPSGGGYFGFPFLRWSRGLLAPL
jgi:hypothetical protein